MGRFKQSRGPICVLCQGPMRTFAPHSKAFTDQDRPYNESRHAWMTRFRVVALLNGECFMTGQARPHRFYHEAPKCKLGNYLKREMTDVCCTKDDGLIDITQYWPVMISDQFVPFLKIHDSCLVVLARVFHGHLSRRGLSKQSFSQFKVDPRMMYEALDRASNTEPTKFGKQYLGKACAYRDFFLDPLHIPELEALAAAPPQWPAIPGDDTPISRLPAEIALMIIPYLDFEDEISLAAAEILPARLFRDWQVLLQNDMPWLFELESLDKDDRGINWARIYMLCRWDSEFVYVNGRLTKRMQREESRSRKLADVNPRIEHVARQVHEQYRSMAKTDFSAEDDLMAQYMIDLDDVQPPPRSKREEEENRPCEFDCSDPPRFPGLSNRQRVWNLCCKLLPTEDDEGDETDGLVGFV